MRVLRFISRILLGVLFVFSGFVKAVDPMGSAYKFSDYFHAFGLDFLDSLSIPLALFLSSFEWLLGLALILGYQKKKVYWILLFFMGFFTVLTLVLAITNPVTDCGCFGDAVILTNWETFFKNVVFMIFVLVLFRSRNQAENVLQGRMEQWLLLTLFAGIFSFSLYTLRHLPAIDFRPYDTGTFIPGEMEIPEGAPRDEYKTILFYRNLETGKTEEYTIENYPEDTVRYEFVTSESKLVKKGYEPPIHDFGIMDPYGMDISDELLSFQGYTLFMLIHDLAPVDDALLQQAESWHGLQALAPDFKFIPVTASTGDIIEDKKNSSGISYDFFGGDEIMLKTMIRSNPGFLLLKNGTIISKWGHRDFPGMEQWSSDWPEMISQYSETQDPAIRELVEAGLMENLRFDHVDFDRTANNIVIEEYNRTRDVCRWMLFIMIVMILLLALQLLPKWEKRRRD